MSLPKPGPTPRVEGRYLVVAADTTLPKLCIRTGRPDDLVERVESVRASRAVERAVGAFGAAWAYQDSTLRYWINRGELTRLKRLRRIWVWLIGAMIVVLAVGLFFRQAPITVTAFFPLCALVTSYQMLPSAPSVAAVWGGQIFLLRVPREIVQQVMERTVR